MDFVQQIITDIDNIPSNIAPKMELYNYGKIKSHSNNENEIKIIWSDSILFQNFQRFIHGENTTRDYMHTLQRYLNLSYHIYQFILMMLKFLILDQEGLLLKK